jgi:hypothetical protein
MGANCLDVTVLYYLVFSLLIGSQLALNCLKKAIGRITTVCYLQFG